MVTKRCDYCGKEFEAEYDGKFMFCSDECKKEGKRIFSTITKECMVCRREFETARKNTSCCSDECRKEANRIRNREGYKPTKLVAKVCEICGREFEGHGNAKYCCDECRKEGRKKSQQKYDKSEKGKASKKRQYESAKPVTKIKCIIDEEIDDGVFISRPSVSKIMGV